MAKRKRGNGEGSVHQVSGKKLWRAVLTSRDVDGKRTRRVKYAKSKAGALEELRKMVAEGPTAPRAFDPVTVATLVHRFLARPGEKRPTTMDSYRTVAKKHVIPKLGSLLISRLQAEHITAMLEEMEASGIGPSKRCHALTVVRQSFELAKSEGTISHNPAVDVSRPKLEHKEFHVFDANACRKFLAAIRGHRLEALFATAVGTGLREGELLALRRSDVNLEAARIVVRRTVVELENKFVEGPPKTKAGRRTVTIPEFAVKALRHCCSSMGANDRLFVATNGQYPRRQNLNRSLKLICRKAGLPELRFHDLRHTSLTLLLAAGENPKVVQERAGHSRITVTLETYSHVLPGMQEQAAGRIQDIIGGDGGHDRVA